MDTLINLLSDSGKLQNILQSISSYVIYIYPGIISIYWKNFLEAKSTKDTQALIIKSFSISYLYNIAFNAFLSYDVNSIQYNILLLITSIVIPFIYWKIRYSKLLNGICERMGIRTCISSVPFELLKSSEEKYTCLKVYLKDDISAYIGYMSTYEYDEGNERFIILSGYKKYFCEGRKERLVIDNEAFQGDQKVYIKYDDIKVIEKIAEDIANCKIYCSK